TKVRKGIACAPIPRVPRVCRRQGRASQRSQLWRGLPAAFAHREKGKVTNAPVTFPREDVLAADEMAQVHQPIEKAQEDRQNLLEHQRERGRGNQIVARTHAHHLIEQPGRADLRKPDSSSQEPRCQPRSSSSSPASRYGGPCPSASPTPSCAPGST